VNGGFAAADAVVEMTFRTPVQMHTPMEVHASVAQWDGDRLTVWDSTHGVYAIRESLAGTFKLPLASVRVISHYMGGGFGSKIELGKYTAVAALFARRLDRPVKAALTREETFLVAGNRPSNVIWLKVGAKKDGTLTALDARFLGPAGAYPTGATSTYQIGDLYTCPNVRTDATHVLINAGRARAFRAPGFPPCNWALEQVIDTLSEKLGLDPIELRLKNIPAVSQLNDNAPCTSTGLAECLREGAQAFGWSEARRRPAGSGPIRRGIGVAAGMWGYGGEPNATAIVTLYADGSVSLNTGASDLGTGTKTVLAMVVAEGALVGQKLSAATASRAATAAAAGAEPLSENGYKVALVRGIVEEAVLSLA
jgi:CO/xanthine dehydrogenase Mo-binding subunit